MRPLNFGEILDVAIKIVTRNALTLFKLVAIIAIPLQVFTTLVLASAGADLSSGSLFNPAAPDTTISSDEVWKFVAGTIVVIVANFIAAALATAACYRAVGDAYLGGKPGWRDSLRYGLRRLHSVLWVTLLVTLAVGGIAAASVFVAALFIGMGGAGAAVVFGLLGFLGILPLIIWLYFAWSVAVPAQLTEDVRGTKAMARSFRLVRGRWWPVFGVQIVASAATTIVASIFSVIPGIVLLTDLGENDFASATINGLATALASVITTPFLAAVAVVLYFDLRVRKEGFDLQLLARHIGVPSPEGIPEGVLPPPPRWGPAAYPQQGYPPQGYPPQGYPPQGYPQQGYPPPAQPGAYPPPGPNYAPPPYGGPPQPGWPPPGPAPEAPLPPPGPAGDPPPGVSPYEPPPAPSQDVPPEGGDAEEEGQP